MIGHPDGPGGSFDFLVKSILYTISNDTTVVARPNFNVLSVKLVIGSISTVNLKFQDLMMLTFAKCTPMGILTS